MDEKTIKTTRIFSGKILNLRVDEVRLQNGRTSTREIVEHPGAVAILPVLKDGSVLLVKQYRKPIEEYLLEVPAGKLEVGEELLECAKRELEEETGYSAKDWKYLGYIYTTPGFSNEKIHLYLAENLEKTTQNTDEDEFIEVVKLPEKKVIEMISKGEITDSKTICIFFRKKLLKLQTGGDDNYLEEALR